MNRDDFYKALKAKAESPEGLLQVIDILIERADAISTRMADEPVEGRNQNALIFWCEVVRCLRGTALQLWQFNNRRMP